MPPKRPNSVPSISPVLFMTVDGEPMSFFLRPCPVKRKLQPLIAAGGGKMCNVQQPGAILLIDPKEKSTVPLSAAHCYVSTQYIHDCIEKEEQLDLENYRLNPEVAQRHSPRLSRKESSAKLSGGRVAYTSEDDAAILNYVSKRKKEAGGNRLWQQMEKQRVTCHSWQSMKFRYKERLAKKQAGIAEGEVREDDKKAEENTEVEANQECDAEKSACEADVAQPLTHSADSDLTQIDVGSVPAGITPESEDAQTTSFVTEEEQHSQETDGKPDENTQSESVEVETSPSSETVNANLQTDARPGTSETAEPEKEGPETTGSPQKQNLPKDDSSPAQTKCTPKNSSSKRRQKKQEASPEQELPQRRITRRQLELESLPSSPEPHGKKLKSSSSSTKRSISSPKLSKKTAVESAHQEDSEQPAVKKARGQTEAAESVPEQRGQDVDSQTSQTDDSNLVPQKAEKKKEKRKLGILEMATKEFEDESESDEDEAPDVQNCSKAPATSTEPPPQPSDLPAQPSVAEPNPEPGPAPRESVPESQVLSDNCGTHAGPSEAVVAEPAVSEPGGASKAHLFIFDSESQEEESQSVVGSAALSNPQRTVDRDDALCLTQVQLEEDKQRIRELMRQTNQDLVSVTKALLKTSGDFSAALNLLLNSSSDPATVWNCCDDRLLRSAEPGIRQKLQEKYGEENVAKRIVFLEVEG